MSRVAANHASLAQAHRRKGQGQAGQPAAALLDARHRDAAHFTAEAAGTSLLPAPPHLHHQAQHFRVCAINALQQHQAVGPAPAGWDTRDAQGKA